MVVTRHWFFFSTALLWTGSSQSVSFLQ